MEGTFSKEREWGIVMSLALWRQRSTRDEYIFDQKQSSTCTVGSTYQHFPEVYLRGFYTSHYPWDKAC